MAASPGFNIKQPVSIWNKPIKTDFTQLFTQIGLSAVNAATGSASGVFKELIKEVKSFRFQEDPAQLAWRLIFTSLAEAAHELILESSERLGKKEENDLKSFNNAFVQTLEEAEISIDGNFFERPKQVSILVPFQNAYAAYLVNVWSLNKPEAATMAARLPEYFVYSLIHEWRENKEKYEIIKLALNTPFTKAGEKEQSRRQYRQWLIKETQKPVFDETFGLDQVYVPLRTYFITFEKDEESRQEKKEIRHVVDLTTAVINWIDAENKDDAIRVIRGGPGCGKSTFAKMPAAILAVKQPDLPVLFIPLHRFDMEKDLVRAVHEFINLTDILDFYPLDKENNAYL